MIEDDPIRAICWAFNLPPESSFHRSKQSIQTWDEYKQLLSTLDLRARQLFWAMSFLIGKDVDSKALDKAILKNPPPDDVALPSHIKKIVEEFEEAKMQQKRAELAAAASKEKIEEMKYILSLPRTKDAVIEVYDD